MPATTYRGITIEISGDATDLQKKLAEVREKSKYAYAGLRDVNSALKFDDSSVTALTQKQRYLTEAIEATRERQDAYRMGLATLDQRKAEGAELTAREQAQYDQLQRSIEQCDRQVKAYDEQLRATKATTEAQESALRSLGKSAEDAGQRLQSIGGAMASAGDSLTRSVTLPLVAGATVAVKAATDMDTSYHNLTKTVSGSDAELQALRDSALELSKTQPVSASDILNIEALGGQLGIANGNLEAFATTVSGLSISTDMGVEDAAMNLAQFANIMQMDQANADRYGSTIVALGNSFATTESDVSAMSMRVAAAGKQMGLSEADVLGLSTALTSMGINAEAGGTAISTIMSNIDKDVATGAKSVETWAEVAGMGAQEFAEAWRSSPIEALQAVFAGMEQASESGTNLNVVLEELGISNIRQTDLMKRLAGNSEVLAQAVQTANQAWQANSALSTEVGNRNESLASKFEVLRNRATAVAAEVGKPLADALLAALDAAQPLIESVESGAKAFADMDEGQQRAIVTAVALVAALGPALSIVGRLTTGVGSLLTSMGSAAQGISTFVGAIRSGSTAMQAAEAVSEGLSATLATGLVGIGIAAAVVAIGALVSAIQEWQRHQEQVQQATTGLTEAMGAAKTAYDSYATGAETAAMSVKSLREMTDEAIESQAQLAEEISKTWTDVGTNAAMVDSFAQTIAELTSLVGENGEAASLNAEQQAELIAAVEGYNDLTGSTITVVDEVTGALDTSTEAILANADAWKQQAESQAAYEVYKDLVKQQIENEIALAEATERLDRAQESADSGWFVDMRDGASSASQAVSAYTSEVDELSRAHEANAQAQQQALSRMQGTESRMAAIEAALAVAGDSLQNYGSLTKEQLAQVAAAFDGTAASAQAALARISQAASESGDAAATAAESAVATTAAAASDAADEAYKAQQKAYDDAYKAQQKAYDASYRAQQKAYDNEYKALQKRFDHEYKAQQKAYDAEYKALQKRFDSEYKAAQKAYDSEYKAAQKANEKRLADLKKSQEAEVSAFKAATDDKIGEVNRLYDAQVAAAEAEYGSQTGDIDKRIAQIEAESAAEERAMEERERAEKISELERNVTQAKSRRTREEAEKALADYRAQIRHQDRESERQALIESLNDEKAKLKESLDARKASIEEQRTTEVEAIKVSRAAQLEAIKEANDAEYEQTKEQLTSQLELLKEQQSSELERLKESQTTQLETLKESQQASLEQLKESQSAQLEGLKVSQSASLEAMREAQSSALESMRSTQQAALESLKADQAAEVEAVRASTQEEEQALEERKGILDTAYGKIHTVHERRMAEMAATSRDGGRRSTKALDEEFGQIAGKVGAHGASAVAKLAEKLFGGMGKVKSNAGNVTDAADKEFSRLPGVGTAAAEGAVSSLAQGLRDDSGALGTTAGGLVSDIESPISDLGDDAYAYGWDFTKNLDTGLVNYWNWYGKDNVDSIATYIQETLGHSKPKRGPLRDDDKWGAHLVQNITDGMASMEGEAARQATSLAKALEGGFSPDLSASPTIGDMSGARRSVDSLTAGRAAPEGKFVMNVTFDRPTIRDDADIDKIMVKMEAVARRANRSRLKRGQGGLA